MKKWIVAAVMAASAGACFAQTADWKFYRLNFVVKEVEGAKVLNSRSFSTVVQVDAPGMNAEAGSIRTGSKVPSGGNYIDIGVNIDVRRVRELPDGDLGLSVSADLSSTAPEGGMPDRPVIRQNRWSSYVVVPVNKPTVLFASDDATSKHQIQLELTASRVGAGATMK